MPVTVYVTRREAVEGLIALGDLKLITEDEESIAAIDGLREKLAAVLDVTPRPY